MFKKERAEGRERERGSCGGVAGGRGGWEADVEMEGGRRAAPQGYLDHEKHTPRRTLQ